MRDYPGEPHGDCDDGRFDYDTEGLMQCVQCGREDHDNETGLCSKCEARAIREGCLLGEEM